MALKVKNYESYNYEINVKLLNIIIHNNFINISTFM